MIIILILISLEIKDITFAILEQRYIQLYSRGILLLVNTSIFIFFRNYQRIQTYLISMHFIQNCCFFGLKSLWYLHPLLQNIKSDKHNQFIILITFLIISILDLILELEFSSQNQIQYIITVIFIVLYLFLNFIDSFKIIKQAQQLINDILINECILKVYDIHLNDLTPNVLQKQQVQENFQSPSYFTTRQTKSNDTLCANNTNRQINFKTYKVLDQYSSNDSVLSQTYRDQKFNNIKDLVKQYLNDNKISDQIILANEYDYKTGQKIKYKLIISRDIKNYIIVALIKLDSVYLLKQLNKLSQFKQQLAQIFTNKLKTPLNATFGYLNQSMKDQNISQHTKLQYLAPALLNSKLQLYQIQDLLDYLYQDTTQISLQITKTNVNKLLYNVNELLEQQCRLKDITVKYMINNINIKNCQQIYIHTDQQKLERILINLLNNSYRHSPLNSSININIEIDEEENKAYFHISDNGEGFTQEQMRFINKQALIQNKSQLIQNHCFDKYQHFKIHVKFGISLQITNNLIYALSDQQSSLQLNTSQQGANFEFFICTKQFNQFPSSQKLIQNQIKQKQKNELHNIEQNNGSFWSESSSILAEPIPQIPLNQNKQSQPKNQIRHQRRFPSIQLTQRSLGGVPFFNLKRASICESVDIENDQQILIVDDEPFNHDILCLMLKKLGFTKFIHAFNGQECLDIISKKENHIQLIFMDLDMPILGGIQTTEILIQMMNQNKLDYITIIGCTAHDDYETQINCINSGMTHVLTKPIFLKNVHEIFFKLKDQLPIKSIFISQSIEKHF